ETVESAKTAEVADGAAPNPNPNPQPQPNNEGTVNITGEGKVGSELTATITDADGVPDTGVTYQWQRDGQPIAQANGKTYTLTPDDAGHKISVHVEYTDNKGTTEKPTSAELDIGKDTPLPPVNQQGVITIDGNAKAGETLTAKISDADGVPDTGITYQWQRDGQAIDGQSGKTYALTQEDIGHKISVQATYKDNAGHDENISSTPTAEVAGTDSTNHAPTDITLSQNQVMEGKDGAEIGKLTTTDEDVNDVPTYTVNDERFEVTADGTLKLKAGQHLDFAQEASVNLSVTTDDGHGGTFSKTFTVSVQDDPNYPAQPQGTPVLGLQGVSVVKEGEAAQYKLLLNHPAEQDVTVEVEVTSSGTTHGVQNEVRTLTIPKGESSLTFAVDTAHNGVEDNGSHFKLRIKHAEGATLNTAAPSDMTHGSGGENTFWATNTFSAAGLRGEYRLFSAGPKLVLYLHGEAINDYGQNASIFSEYVADRGDATVLMVKTPDSASGSWSVNGAQNARYLRALLEEIYSKYDLDKGDVLLMGNGGGADFITRYLLPEHNDLFSGGTALMIGGGAADSTLHFGKTPTDGLKQHLQLKWIAGSADGDTVAAAQHAQEQYAQAGFHTQQETIPNGDKMSAVGHIYDAFYDEIDNKNTGSMEITTRVSDIDATNHAPTNITLHQTTIAEGKDGVEIGWLDTVDPDWQDKHSYTVSDERFEVTREGQLKLKAGQHIDYADEQTVTLTITTTDTGGLSFTKAFTLQVKDNPLYPSTENHAPTDIQLDQGLPLINGEQQYYIKEGKDGMSIGMVKTVDPDPQDSHRYALSDERFEITADGILKLKDGVHIDYAAETKVTLTITATDQGGLSVEKTFTLRVDDDPNYPNREGSVTISGDAKVGSTLTANVSDPDTVSDSSIRYQWLIDGVAVQGATQKTYTPRPEDAGKKVSVHVEYRDNGLHDEAHDSDSLDVAAQSANQPGSVTISGEAKVGRELTATVTDADKFDAANVQYQWLRDGQPIDKANGSTYTLSKDDAGHKISVQATYKDNAGHDENPTSEVTDIPAPPPNQPGSISITGEAKVGSELVADVKDDDGVPQDGVKYQWLRDGKAIDGATGKNYTLTAEDAGHKITVKASYEDNAHHAENPESAATDVAANPAPQSEPVLSLQGVASVKEGEAANYTVSLNRATDHDVTVEVEVGSDKANNVRAETLTVTIPKGETSTTFAIETRHDGKDTPQNAFTIHLKNAQGATLASTSEDNPTHGGGGEESQIIEERTFSAAGQTGTYRLSAVGNSDAHPDGLICYLHGDSAEEYHGTPSLAHYGELSANRGGLLLSVKTPDSTTGNWSKNGEDNAQYLRALIEDIYSKYNIDKGKIWFVGYEGGADLITNHLLPQHNDLFSGGGALMIGGGNVKSPLTFSKTPSQELKEHFQMKWLTGSEDTDGLVAAQQGQARYSEAGFHTQRENIPGVDRSESGRGEYGAGVLDGLYTGENLNGMTTSIDDIDHVNRPPTDIELDTSQNHELIEGKDGLKIGSLLVSDPDTSYHSYTVSDARFEITANGVLKLKNDQHFDFAKEPTIKLTITADDGQGGTFSKEFTLQVKDDPNWPTPQPQTNHEGKVTISGDAKVGSELVADVKDDDGVPQNGVRYQWLRDGQAIDGATGKNYTLTADDAGHKISVQATYDDNASHHETPTSTASDIAKPQPPATNGLDVSDASAVIEGNELVYTVKLASPAQAGQVLKLSTDYHNSAVGADKLAQTADPFQPGEYLGNGTVFTRSVADMPLADNSAAITQYAPTMAKNNYGVVTGLNHKSYNIPIYIVDSSDPKQHYATITSDDARVNASADIKAHTTGKIPLPEYATPAGGGDKSFAVYDKATGLMREYFYAVKQPDGSWKVSAAGYFQGQAGLDDLGVKNYWMQHEHGGSAVVRMLNPLSQIGISEILAGRINHAVSVTLPNAKKGVISFPAQDSDGTDENPNAPAEGQWFRIKPGVDLDTYTRGGQPLGELTKMIAKAVQTYGGYGADKNLNNFAFNAESAHNYLARGKEDPWREGGEIAQKVGNNMNINDFPWELVEWAPVGWNDKGQDAGVYSNTQPTASINGQEVPITGGEITLPAGTTEVHINVPTLTHNNFEQTDSVTLNAALHDANGNLLDSGAGTGQVNDAPNPIADSTHGNGVLISPNVNPDELAKLVSLDGQELIDYIDQHGHNILQNVQNPTPSPVLRGGDGDDILVSGYGVDHLAGGKGADTFVYIMDGKNSFPYQNNDQILDFNPAEGDRIVLTRGDGWTLQFDKVEFVADAHVQRLQYKVYKGSEAYINAIHIQSHDGHLFGVEEIMKAVTILG
ncbi:hypothetical protein, partial [Cardiobacterium hominis]